MTDNLRRPPTTKEIEHARRWLEEDTKKWPHFTHVASGALDRAEDHRVRTRRIAPGEPGYDEALAAWKKLTDEGYAEIALLSEDGLRIALGEEPEHITLKKPRLHRRILNRLRDLLRRR